MANKHAVSRRESLKDSSRAQLLSSVESALAFDPLESDVARAIVASTEACLSVGEASSIVVDAGCVGLIDCILDRCGGKAPLYISRSLFGRRDAVEFDRALEHAVQTLEELGCSFFNPASAARPVDELGQSPFFVRRLRAGLSCELGFSADPLFDLTSFDVAWGAYRVGSSNPRGIVVIERSLDGVSSGTTKADLRGVSRIVQFKSGSLLLVFNGNEGHEVEMSCADCGAGEGQLLDLVKDEGVAKTIVTLEEIDLNGGCIVPSLFRDRCVRAKSVSLGALSKTIRRGATCRVSYAGRDRQRTKGDFLMMRARDGLLIGEDDALYVDGSCITKDGEAMAMPLDCIPAGQEKHTVFPEDGEVVLIPRGGSRVASYKAAVPTLVANNVFIVVPKEGLASARYIACALRGRRVLHQLADQTKPLSKTSLSSILLPVPSKGFQGEVVRKREEAMRAKRDLLNTIDAIDEMSPLDPLRIAGSLEDCLVGPGRLSEALNVE